MRFDLRFVKSTQSLKKFFLIIYLPIVIRKVILAIEKSENIQAKKSNDAVYLYILSTVHRLSK